MVEEVTSVKELINKLERQKRSLYCPPMAIGPMKDNKISARLYLVTPENALFILGESEKKGFTNRHERISVIKKYASDMKNGRWQETGDTIKISPDGVLIDGYHRMKAIIQSGVSIPMLIAYNVPKLAFEKIDSGQKRTLADIFYIKGYRKYTTPITMAAKVLAAFRKSKGEVFTTQSGLLKNLTLAEIESILNEHNNLLENAACFYATQRLVIITQSILLSLWTLFGLISEDKCNEFFNLIKTGENLDKNHPCLKLRDLLLGFRLKTKISMISSTYEAAIVIKAWNAFYTQKKIKELKHASNHSFPIIEGLDYARFIRGWNSPVF